MLSSMATSDIPNVVELKGQVMHYAWGKVGQDSKVAQLAKRHSEKALESIPYAEVDFILFLKRT